MRPSSSPPFRARAVELVLQHRLPAVSGNRAFADAGGLMSYAASLADRYREAGAYVDKILKGRKPSELPVQQPTSPYRPTLNDL